MKRICFFVLTLVFGAATALPAQVSSGRPAPVKQTVVPPIDTPQIARERSSPLLALRFRGWRHMPAGARTRYQAQRDLGHSGEPQTATRRVATSSQAQIPASNGFGFRPSLFAGQIPTAVAIGDFNGDGKLDWAVSNGEDDSIWIYLGNGDGTSQLPTIIPTAGLGAAWLIAIDLNGDGKPDLVVAEADTSTIGVLLGNGDGTFKTEIQYSLPAPPIFLIAANFTGDGKMDIAAAMIGSTSTGPVAVLPGDGQGHLGAPLFMGDPTPSTGYWLTLANLRKGVTDLIVVDPYDFGNHGGAQVYLNNGTGTFAPGQFVYGNEEILGVPPDIYLSAAVGSLSSGACKDLVITDSYGLAFVFTGNCDGTFSYPPVQYALGDMAVTVQLADVNGDGVLDMVTSGACLDGSGGIGLGSVAGDEVSILFGDGTGNFGPGRTYRGDMDMYSLAIGDVNGDGFPDLITANQGSNTVNVFLNDAKGGFGDPQGEAFGNTTGDSTAPASPFIFADVDGNGTVDMVVFDNPQYPGDAEQITTFLNDGTGKFSAPVISPAWTFDPSIAPGSMTLADFRNTGRPDLLILGSANSANPTPFMYFFPNMGGGQFGSYTMSTPPGAVAPLAVGDFNGDGNLDFTTVTAGGGPVNYLQTFNVFLGKGDGTFQTGQSFDFLQGNVDAYPKMMFSGDFNRDGNLDVLVWDGGLYEFLGNGDGTFQAGRPLLTTFGSFVMADVNKDGFLDIIAATDSYGNAADEVYSVFLGQPDGTFQFAEGYSPYLYQSNGPSLLGSDFPAAPLFPGLLGDFNGDGIPDLALFPTPGTDPVMQILYGNGDGTFTPSFASYPFYKPYVPQLAADVNGDGRADLIELDRYTASFNVVKSTTPGPGLQLELLPTPVAGPSGTGRVILNIPSQKATTVSFVTSDPGIAAPSITIPAGSVSQDFQFSISSGFSNKKVFSIQAQAGGATAIAEDYVFGPELPVIEFQPPGLIFSGIVYGNANSTQPVTMKNVGTAVLTISSISVGGGLGWFTETDNCDGSLAPGASCTIQVTFISPFPGEAMTDLTVSDNVTGVFQTMTLEGMSISPLEINPCCVGLSEPVGGTSAPQAVTLSNLGTTPIQVSSVVAAGAGIAETNNCTSIAAGGSCQVSVTFSPTSGEDVVGTLTLNTSVPNTTAFIVPISGNTSDFSLGTASPQTVSAGQTATYNLTASASGGFSGTLTLSCTGAPTDGTCTVSPTAVSLALDGSAQYVVTVTTTARSTITAGPSPNSWIEAKMACGFCLLSFAALFRPRNRRTFGRTIGFASALSLSLAMFSCGGSSAGGGSGGQTTGTSAGTYAITVTGASGSVTRTATLSMTVQ